MDTNYNDLIDKIFSLSKHGIKMGLENMVQAMQALSLDINRIRFVHIAGTNGKGSTAVTLESLIRRHSNGKKVGLYTSPHLIRFNERITIDGVQISNEEIVSISDEIFKKCTFIPLTFFELTTLMALQHFVNNKVSFAVIETGLGGRLDATNIITPEVAIITSIGFDHMEYLGNTINEIATEKAGIFKKGTSVVLGDTCCKELLLNKACSAGVKKVLEFGKDFKYTTNSYNNFNFYINSEPVYKNITKKLLGNHQYINTCMALTAFELIGLKGTNTSVDDALKAVSWPGRLELLNIQNKKIYLDVSHNPEGIQMTISYLRETHHNEPIYIACGFMKDKDYNEMIKMLSSISKKMFLIPTNVSGRELGMEEYKKLDLDRQNTDILICTSIKDAVHNMLKEDGVLLFTGSIYNYAHISKALQDVT